MAVDVGARGGGTLHLRERGHICELIEGYVVGLEGGRNLISKLEVRKMHLVF